MISKTDDERRLIIALGITATSVGAFALDISRQFPELVQLALVTLYVSGFLSFLYIIFTAARLKYDHYDNDSIGTIPYTEGVRKFCFDYAINIFGYNFILWMAIVVGHILKKQGIETHYFRYGLLITFIILMIYVSVFAMAKKRSSRKALKK